MVVEKCSNTPIVQGNLMMIDQLVNKIKHVHSKFRLFPKKKPNKYSNYSIFYNYLLRYPQIDEQLLIGNPPRTLLESFNSESFPIGCKYLLFDRLVFRDALHYFSSFIFNSTSREGISLENEYWKVFDNQINSVDVSKGCVDSGGRIGFVDVYNEISKYFPQRNVVGQLMVLNRENSLPFRNEIFSLANYWYGIETVGIKDDSKLTGQELNSKVSDKTVQKISIENSPVIATTSTRTNGLRLRHHSLPPISMKRPSNSIQEWIMEISWINQCRTLVDFIYRDCYTSTVYKTYDFVTWLVNIIDFSQTQLKEVSPYMLHNPYVTFLSHMIVSSGFIMMALLALPYVNSVSFSVFLVSILCFETLTCCYMFLDNSDRAEVELTHIVRGEKLWLFYQLLNCLYIPMVSLVFCKNRNAVFVPTASCFVLSQLYMYNSIALFEFFNQLALVLFTLGILRSINFGEFIVRDVVETVKQDFEIDRNSVFENNKELFESVKEYNETHTAPTTIFIDERPASQLDQRPAETHNKSPSTFDVFIHEFSHIPIEPAMHNIVDALLGPVEDVDFDVSEMAKEMPTSPCPTYTEDIRE